MCVLGYGMQFSKKISECNHPNSIRFATYPPRTSNLQSATGKSHDCDGSVVEHSTHHAPDTSLVHPSQITNQGKRITNMSCPSSKTEVVKAPEPTTTNAGRTADATEATAKPVNEPGQAFPIRPSASPARTRYVPATHKPVSCLRRLLCR